MERTIFDLQSGDCVEGMRCLPDESVDVVVTSPPYNIGARCSRLKEALRDADAPAESHQWAEEVRRVLKPDGALFLNVGASPSNPLLPHQLALRFSSLFVLQNTIHWVKSITLEVTPIPGCEPELVSFGHFKPIHSSRFLTDCHEYIFHFTKAGDVPLDRLAVGVPYHGDTTRWRRTGGLPEQCRGNNWFVPHGTIRNRRRDRSSLAAFPSELAAMCLRLHGVSCESVVLDPFLGRGHSAQAARECGVGRFIGFESDETCFAEAQRRIEKPRFPLPEGPPAVPPEPAPEPAPTGEEEV